MNKNNNKKHKILITADRAGYGHIRCMIAFLDACLENGLDAQTALITNHSSKLYRSVFYLWNNVLGAFYKFAPGIYSNQKREFYRSTLINGYKLFKILDWGKFQKYIFDNKFDVLVAAMPTAGYLIDPSRLDVYMMGLDDFAPLYFSPIQGIVHTAVSEEMKKELEEYQVLDPKVIGPYVASPIRKARLNFLDRISELKNGAPLKITISTGGSLTHEKEIVALAKAFNDLTNEDQISKINVVVGDSRSMRKSLRKAKLDKRLNIIYDKDIVRQIRRADEAMGESDIIFAKTGELAFVVSGGKVLKPFYNNPSLGPQEIANYNYVLRTTQVDNLAAIETGIEPKEEVSRILQQRESGDLYKMMELGLRVPSEGVQNLVNMITDKYAV